jgi:drug/metabolite transporter (DMT)-like permease
MDVDVSYATALAAALLLGVGFVLQQYSAEQEPDSRFLSPRILTDLLRKPRWLAGIACMIAGMLLAAWSIGHLELTLVEPLLSTNLLFALVLAVPMSKQAFRLPEIVGALLLCTGVALLSSTRTTTPIGLSFGSVSHWYAAAIIAGIAFISVQLGHHAKGQARATLTGLGAGLVFGIQDALTRQTLEVLQGNSWTVLFSTWSAYALVGAGITGVWLMQNAFSVAPLRASLPTIAAGEPLAGIVLGIVVFGDRIQISPGMLAVEAGGIAALIVGVVAVARSSALSGLRTIVGHLPGVPETEHEDQQEKEPVHESGGSERLLVSPRAGPVSAEPRDAQPDCVAPRFRIRSSATPTLPSASTICLMIAIMVGTAQKSPHTHKIAAPICWSANGGSVTPGTCAYTEYSECEAKMLSAMASPIITRLVTTSPMAWLTSGIRRRNGGDGMYWSQNRMPARKKLPCISQMCTMLLRSARSYGPGRCHRTITKLNIPTETQGRSSTVPRNRSGDNQRPASTPRVTLVPERQGSASSSGCHGAPATISDGAANISSRCCSMCTKK